MIIYFLLVLLIYICYFYLSNNGGNSLDEVVLHVSLQVEIGQLLGCSDVKKLGELGVGVNLASIHLVLKTVSNDILVNLLTDSGSSHLSSNGLSKKLGELITDTGGLDKP